MFCRICLFFQIELPFNFDLTEGLFSFCQAYYLYDECVLSFCVWGIIGCC